MSWPNDPGNALSSRRLGSAFGAICEPLVSVPATLVWAYRSCGVCGDHSFQPKWTRALPTIG